MDRRGQRIARVFPTRTAYTPIDEHAYFSSPGFFTPKYDEVHVSVVFKWDIGRAYELAAQWTRCGKVRVGGPAIDGEPDGPMTAGMYLKHGVTITTRGCPNNCWFCHVRHKFVELDDFPEGNTLQDNNILASSLRHWRRVMVMLRGQRAIEFKGGLEAARMTPRIAEDLCGLRIKALWLACDTPAALKPLRRAVEMLLAAGFKQYHLYSYVLIGKDMEAERMRLNEIIDIGCTPFAQLYQSEKRIEYSLEWKRFNWEWSRMQVIRSKFKRSSYGHSRDDEEASIGGVQDA